MPTWDSKLYLNFANERTQPSIDLVARIPLDSPANIVDLGCGPGNSTTILRQRWADAQIVGVDNSPEMIATASAKYPQETDMAIGRHRGMESGCALRHCFLECDSPVDAQSFGTAPASAGSSRC